MNRRNSLLLRFVIAGICLLVISILHAPWSKAEELRVIDGDTLVLHGETIRLHGIDAPELAQSCKSSSGKTFRCGRDARHILGN